MNVPQIDIAYTYRGFRLQALYALWRIFTSSEDTLFQPEGKEDLAIYDSSKKLIEVIQVKAYSGNLTLSKFDLNNSNSFFNRGSSYLTGDNAPKVLIVSFGDIGEEIEKAWASKGQERDKVVKKLSSTGHLNEEQASQIVQKIELIKVSENKLEEEINRQLKEHIIDPRSAFELLHAWLFKCSEKREIVSSKDVIEKINNIGKFLSSRAEHHREWFTSILPLEETETSESSAKELGEEYYSGISARYEHIQMQLDVPRLEKIIEIAKQFKTNRVVIVHGASGQGKTTLAYRYLHEYHAGQWRYQIKLIEDRQHALKIAAALSGYANAIDVPIIVYIDVSASDRNWPDLVKHLYEHQNILILVTIREEELRRASSYKSDFKFTNLELSFDKEEAQLIYNTLTSNHPSEQFLNFGEAWTKFGGRGPLLEFVHLITQGKSLRDRLVEQINRISDEVRTGSRQKEELEALRLIAVVSAYEAKLKVKDLAELLGLSAPQRTFELFEKEYLLRLSEDMSLIHGLHPIRSEILADILTDQALNKWADSAGKCISMINGNDVEPFLLYAFSRRHSECKEVLRSLRDFHPSNWSAIAGILRALLWLGTKEYVEENEKVIDSMHTLFGKSFSLFMDFDIANATSSFWDEHWENSKLFPKENIEVIKAAKAKQTDKKNVVKYAIEWLSTFKELPQTLPKAEEEWLDLADVLLWLGKLEIDTPIKVTIPDDAFKSIIENLDINTLGGFSLGLSYLPNCELSQLFNKYTDILHERYMKETNTFKLEDDGCLITAHYIVDLFDVAPSAEKSAEKSQDKDKMHTEALMHIELLRNLFPERNSYSCQGYGHTFMTLPYDATHKTIQKSLLIPKALVVINTVFRGLMLRKFRPDNWKEYVSNSIDLRASVVKSLKQVISGVNAHFLSKGVLNIFEKYINTALWDEVKRNLDNPPMLPKNAVDEWGFVAEGNTPDSNQNNLSELYANFVFKNYEKLLKTSNEYFRCLGNFYNQAQDSLVLLPNLGRSDKLNHQKLIEIAKEQGINEKFIRLSLVNFFDSVKALPHFQSEFNEYFERLVNHDQLNGLAVDEASAIRKLLPAWYFFTQKPQLKINNSSMYCAEKFDKKRKEIFRNIRNEMKRISQFNSVKVRFLDNLNWWADKKAFYISADFQKPYDSLPVLEELIKAIQSAINKIEDNELRRITLESHFENIIIVPLVQGNSLAGDAWKFHCHTILNINLDDKDAKCWQIVPEKIPNDIINALELTVWNSPRLEVAFRLMIATQELFFYSQHMSEFDALEDLDDLGILVLQKYVSALAGKVNNTLQDVLDLIGEMVNYWNLIPEDEQGTRDDLFESIKCAINLRDFVNPKGDKNLEMRMNLSDIKQWSLKLSDATGFAVQAYWCWAADVIENDKKVAA